MQADCAADGSLVDSRTTADGLLAHHVRDGVFSERRSTASPSKPEDESSAEMERIAHCLQYTTTRYNIHSTTTSAQFCQTCVDSSQSHLGKLPAQPLPSGR